MVGRKKKAKPSNLKVSTAFCTQICVGSFEFVFRHLADKVILRYVQRNPRAGAIPIRAADRVVQCSTDGRAGLM